MKNSDLNLMKAMMPFDYNIFRLSNGMRCVHRLTSSNVCYAGVAVNAGARDDPGHLPGLAHFVEHTIFKGTKKRNSWSISDRMESIGGELNAYTSKENTVIYSIAPGGYAGRAIELLADLIINASFPAAELEKEKEVVIEEIHGVLDNPAEALFDEFERLAYEGNDLGHDILGSPESVRGFTSDDCCSFMESLYTPGEMVLFVQSSDATSNIERLAEKYFGSLSRPDMPRKRFVPELVPSFSRVNDRNGHQAHTLIGAPAFSRHDPRKFALLLYNNLLGGPSMNSRLNQELRERRGLVYTVDSSVSLLSDCGMEYIYFATDRDSVKKCNRIIDSVLGKLANKPLSESTFCKIKRQYCGQLLVNSDNMESAAMSMGKSLLFYNEIHDRAYIAERVSEVTPREFQEVAELVAQNSAHILTLC